MWASSIGPGVGEGGGDLQRREHLTTVAGAALDEQVDGVGVGRRAQRLETAGDEHAQVVRPQRLEPEQRGAAAQRRVDLEERVLGRRPDEHERAVLDGREQGVLLRLGEAVDLVEEQDRALVALAEALAGPFDDLAHVLDAGRHGRQLLERTRRGAGDGERERRLARARRSPQQHRGQPVLLDETAQRTPRAEQLRPGRRRRRSCAAAAAPPGAPGCGDGRRLPP